MLVHVGLVEFFPHQTEKRIARVCGTISFITIITNDVFFLKDLPQLCLCVRNLVAQGQLVTTIKAVAEPLCCAELEELGLYFCSKKNSNGVKNLF